MIDSSQACPNDQLIETATQAIGLEPGCLLKLRSELLSAATTPDDLPSVLSRELDAHIFTLRAAMDSQSDDAVAAAADVLREHIERCIEDLRREASSR